jgi:predicted nucleic acid-binding protein
MVLSYLDSSVLVAWALDKDPQHAKADQIIDDIRNGRIVAITSSFALMEVIDAIRKRVTQWARHAGHPRATNMNFLVTQITEVIRKFLNGVTALAAQRKLIWDDPNQTVKNVFEEALPILRNTFGSFGNASRCKFCEQPLLVPKYYYRGVGQYDVQHAILARELKADALITFDRGFTDLAGHPAFSAVTFDVR